MPIPIILDGIHKYAREYHKHAKPKFAFSHTYVPACLTALPISTPTLQFIVWLQTRRLHSVLTASLEIGVGTAVLARFMETAGVIALGDPRPVARRTFDAVENADLLSSEG